MRLTYIREVDTAIISFSPELPIKRVRSFGTSSVGLSSEDYVVMVKVKNVSKRPNFPEALYTFFANEKAPEMRDVIRDAYEDSWKKLKARDLS